MTKSKSSLSFIKPFVPFVPEIEEPIRAIALRDKVIWTFIALFIYLICCQIPLYGVAIRDGTDPLYMLRMMLASNKGSLMELGIQPIITSGMILQLLAGAGILKIDQNDKEESQLFSQA
jgi:protein transport protein SEC61 subunit alpha